MTPTESREKEWLQTATVILTSIIRNRENLTSIIDVNMVETASRWADKLLAQKDKRFRDNEVEKFEK